MCWVGMELRTNLLQSQYAQILNSKWNEKKKKKNGNCRKIYEYFAVAVKKNFIKNHLFREFSSIFVCVWVWGCLFVCSAGSFKSLSATGWLWNENKCRDGCWRGFFLSFYYCKIYHFYLDYQLWISSIRPTAKAPNWIQRDVKSSSKNTV